MTFDCGLHHERIPERKLVVAAAAYGGEDHPAVDLHQWETREIRYCFLGRRRAKRPRQFARDGGVKLLHTCVLNRMSPSPACFWKRARAFLRLTGESASNR